MKGYNPFVKNNHPHLTMPVLDIVKIIDKQIEKGRRLIQVASELEELNGNQIEQEIKVWDKNNLTLLALAVDTDELTNGYEKYPASVTDIIDRWYADIFTHVSDRIHYLKMYVKPRLEFLGNFSQRSIEKKSPNHFKKNNRVFVVHGHDEETKQTVARFIEKVNLEAVILHEQPNRGRTIIEKFENYSDVSFAVVLLTPDDYGASKNKKKTLFRARQNVILELGFFIGKLGRDRVCALHKGQIELPSDLSGVLWVKLDEDGAWRITLAKEIQSAGINIDLTQLTKF